MPSKVPRGLKPNARSTFRQMCVTCFSLSPSVVRFYDMNVWDPIKNCHQLHRVPFATLPVILLPHPPPQALSSSALAKKVGASAEAYHDALLVYATNDPAAAAPMK